MTKYAKYISEEEIQIAPKNYQLDDGTVIFNFDTDVDLMLQYGFKPLTEVERPETQRHYQITYTETETTVNEVLTYTETEEEYEARIAQEERAKKDAMTLTPADVWRALYKAKTMTKESLLTLIETQMTSIDMNAVEIEFGASSFYRGAKLGSGRLFDVIGNLLGYTSEDMDYLFEHKELPEEEDEDTANAD